MDNNERIAKRAYEIHKELGSKDEGLNWHLAKLDIAKEDYYATQERCPSCGKKGDKI